MAQITFTAEEAINLLRANDLLPDVITGITVKEDTLVLKVAAPVPLVDYLPVSVRYVGFEKGVATVEVSAGYLKGRVLEAILKLVKAKLEENFADEIQLDYPRLYVHINKLLAAKNITAVEVREVTFAGGSFTVQAVSG